MTAPFWVWIVVEIDADTGEVTTRFGPDQQAREQSAEDIAAIIAATPGGQNTLHRWLAHDIVGDTLSARTNRGMTVWALTPHCGAAGDDIAAVRAWVADLVEQIRATGVPVANVAGPIQQDRP